MTIYVGRGQTVCPLFRGCPLFGDRNVWIIGRGQTVCPLFRGCPLFGDRNVWIIGRGQTVCPLFRGCPLFGDRNVWIIGRGNGVSFYLDPNPPIYKSGISLSQFSNPGCTVYTHQESL